jgi:hypothetical protein
VNRFQRLLMVTACTAAAATAAYAGDETQSVRRDAEPAWVQAAASDSIAYSINVMDQNQIGLTLSNYGFIGTNFYSSAPSFEFPLGSTHMHLVRGGLWVGGAAFDTSEFIGVSVAAQDGSKGSSGAQNTEYTPGTNRIYSRSTLPSSRVFKTGATSELDFISLFSDMPAKPRSQTGGAFAHRPLGVAVTQYNYSWSFSDYAKMTFFHYVVKNVGDLAITNMWLGMYGELASGSMKDVNFNPGGAWFSKKEIGWVDSLSLFTERYCEYILNPPTNSNCHYFKTPEIVGIKLLGLGWGSVRDTALTKQVTMQAWSWSPGSAARDEDIEKYALMSTGTRTNLNPIPDSLKPVSGDPVELVATGPVPRLEPGDSVAVDFVYIGALDMSQMVARARVAQRAYELNYLVPVPPPSPRMKIVPRANAIDIYWDREPEDFLDPTGRTLLEQQDFEGYRVNVGEERNDLHRVAQFDLAAYPNDSTGFNTGMGAVTLTPPVTIEGEVYHYKYTVDHLRDGFKYWVAVTSYDRGTPIIESLESGLSQNEAMFVPGPASGELASKGVTVFPNPYRVETRWDAGAQARQHYLWFANLPKQCKLKIYTLSGALIYETDFDGDLYTGSNARGIYQPVNDLPSNLSGTMFGWDMITREGQAAATGLYIYAVEDKHTGKHQNGKFLLVKSDRESF